MIKLRKWVKHNWADPVWSKVFAGVILAILGALVTIFVSLYKKIPIDVLYHKALNNYIQINYLSLFIGFLVLLSLLIPAVYFKIIRFQLKKIKFPSRLKSDKFNLELFLNGEWFLKYTHPQPGLTGSEPVVFMNGNHYYINQQLIYILTDIEFTETRKELKWLKIRYSTNQKHSKETLQIINETTITGTDDLGFTLNYTKTSK